MEIVLIKISIFKKKFLNNDASDMNITNHNNIIKQIIKFENLIKVLIKLNPEELFKEVKLLFLNEFESTTNEIKICLEKTKNLFSSK